MRNTVNISPTRCSAGCVPGALRARSAKDDRPRSQQARHAAIDPLPAERRGKRVRERPRLIVRCCRVRKRPARRLALAYG